MKVTKTLVLLLIVHFYSAANAGTCAFANLSLSDLESSSKFQTSFEKKTNFPADLFKAHENSISTFDAESCKFGVAKKQIIALNTSVLYTAFYTTSDECDGGNVYGVITSGISADPSRAVAVIRDSAIECL